MDRYIDQICSALNCIQSDYFKLITTYKPSGIVRERIFCYELYHQLRLAMVDENELTLNGEIDKRAHTDFERSDRKNPDFVFHIPGQHEGNTIVMEVKGRIDDPVGIVKDFKTISRFVDRYQYRLGIFLLYNHSYEELSGALSRFQKVNELQGIDKTIIITKQAYDIPVKVITPSQNKYV